MRREWPQSGEARESAAFVCFDGIVFGTRPMFINESNDMCVQGKTKNNGCCLGWDKLDSLN